MNANFTTQLQSGYFTTGEKSKGNFVGTDNNARIIFIKKETMHAFGVKTTEEFNALTEKPWVLAKVLPPSVIIAEDGSEINFSGRTDGVVIFKNFDEAVKAQTASAVFDAQCAAVVAHAKLNTSVAVKKAAVDQGFTDKYAEELLAASIL